MILGFPFKGELMKERSDKYFIPGFIGITRLADVWTDENTNGERIIPNINNVVI